MSFVQTVALILVAFGAGFIQRVSGFGLGIFAMLFLPHIMPTHTASAAISSMFSLGTSAYNAIRYRKHIPFRMILPPATAAIITIPIAVSFASKISGALFKTILGIVLIGLSLYFLFFNQRVHIRATAKNGFLAGGFGGVLTGLFSTGGPPIVLYLSHATDDTNIYFAATQFYFCLTSIYATVLRILNGTVTQELFLYAILGFLGCLAGNRIGSFFFTRLDSQKLRRIIYIGMIISGILMIL